MPLPPSIFEPNGLLSRLAELEQWLAARKNGPDAQTVRETIRAIEEIEKVVIECDTRIENQAATIESAMNRIAELEGRLKPDDDQRLCPRDPAPTAEQVESAREVARRIGQGETSGAAHLMCNPAQPPPET